MPYKDPAKRAEARRRYEERNPHRRKGDRHKDNRQRQARRRNAARRETIFTGVDGEGWTDETGRHHYMLLVAGDRSLYTGEPLTTMQCLTFLTSLKNRSNHYFVSFFFDYDCTMILRDIVADDPAIAAQIVGAREYGTFVFWRGFSIDYVPKKHIRVRRWGGEVVTVHDTRNFFQTSFYNALCQFGIGTETEREDVRRMKLARADFDADQIDAIEAYCRTECRLLADLVGELRDRFALVGMSAHPYEGPGPVAGRALTTHVGRDRQAAYHEELPAGLLDFAKCAYYGGRFETTALGRVDGPVWGYDLKSAYPAAMTELPCLDHGRWSHWKATGGRNGRRLAADLPSERLYVARLRYDMPGDDWPYEGAPWKVCGPLPHRIGRTGSIINPLGGEGWYWSPEVPPYAQVFETWTYERTCDCRPFEWVRELYEQRAEMERVQKGSGIALKLTLNSLYGKLAQRVGRAPHYNPVWAGLITAITRAKVYQVYVQHPHKVIMFATDAVFLTEPAPELDIGSGLGQWEIENDGEPYDDFVVFRPGIYFDGGTARFKTRGIPKAEFQARADEFMTASMAWLNSETNIGGVTLTRDNHLSLRQGLAWGEKWHGRIGNWVPSPKTYVPNPMPKRWDQVYVDESEGFTSWTRPLPNLGEPTAPYQHQAAQPWDTDALDADRWDDGTYDAMLTEWVEGA